MKDIFYRFIIGIVFLIMTTSLAHSQELRCQPGSGVWRYDSSKPVLDGALCSTRHGGYDFYRLNFGDGTGFFAPAIPGSDSSLRFLFSAQNTFFYADDKSVYAVEKEHFKVIWHRDWPHSELLPSDPFDSKHWAILSRHGDHNELHLVRCDMSDISEEMSASFQTDPLSFVWQPQRFVAIEASQMTIWLRPGVVQTIPPNIVTTFQPPPPAKSWEDTPKVVTIDPVIGPGEFAVDISGIMVLNHPTKRLAYYRFDTFSWTRASINSTASLKSIGTSPLYAMGVTIDAQTVRLVARLGSFLQNRYEAKYWKLSDPNSATLVIGQKDLAALDGGPDNRAQTVDTTDVTWKRIALFFYPSRGRIADLNHNTLVTIHPESDTALIVWHARTGQQRVTLPQAALKGADIISAKIIDTLPRFILVTLSGNQFIIFDQFSGEYTAPLSSKAASQWAAMPLALEVQKDSIILQNDTPVSSWTVLKDSGGHDSQTSTRSLEQHKPEQFEELQTPQEKWYGYCLNNDDCLIPSSDPLEQLRKLPEIVETPEGTTHAPSPVAWVLAFVALLSMVGVRLWRSGFGKKSMLSPATTDSESPMMTTDSFDEKHRRFILDRDNRYFLAPTPITTPIFRMSISVILGLVVALIVASRYYFDDVPLTFLSWVVVLGLPVTAITWIAISWTYWNRYYLLRFGNIMEGKWLNCATPNQSIAYSPDDKVTYELSRTQWRKADFVPMIIYDPARPNFAIQYVGDSKHTIHPLGKISDTPKSACTYDIVRLSIVLFLLACTLASTQILFKVAFPNPLSAWTLSSIESSLDGETTYTMACLDKCNSFDKSCHDQCHHRQLSLVLNHEHKTTDDDPNMTAAEFLDTQRQTVAKARAIVEGQGTCETKNEQLSALALWPEELTDAFWATYSDPDTFNAAELLPVYEGMKNDSDYLRDLCDREGRCAHDAQNCHMPPTCPGSVDELKIRLCSFQSALKIPDMSDEASDE